MNLGISILQSLNQLKFTVIVIALLILYLIFDFHFHLRKGKKKSNSDDPVYINWDSALNKAVLTIGLGVGKTINVALTKEQFQTLRHALNSIDADLHGKNTTTVNVLSRVKPVIKTDKKLKIEIPVKLLKKYQADERKLRHIESSIATEQEKRAEHNKKALSCRK